MKKSILVMLDDTVNFFSEKLEELGVNYKNESDNIADRNFTGVFFDHEGNLTDIGRKAFFETKPKADGIKFLNSLKKQGFTVVLATARDIRLCFDITKEWLNKNGAHYDYLFTATAPAGLCMDMGIPLMVYNLPENGGDNISVVEISKEEAPKLIKNFKTFGELEEWTNLNL